MWARVSSFMQEEHSDEHHSDHQQTHETHRPSEQNSQESPLSSSEQEWRPRFSFSLGLGEMLYSWGFLRRKPSQSDSTCLAPSKFGNAQSSSPNESIELSDMSTFPSAPVSNSSRNKTDMSVLTPNSTIFPKLNHSNLLCESGTLHAVPSVSSLFDSTSVASFFWEEIEDDESGLGHQFISLDTNFPMWCDRCGDLLWGLQEEYLHCQMVLKPSKPSTCVYLAYCPHDQCYRVACVVEDCHYTCHPQCRDLVTLDCRGIQDDTDASCSLSLSEIGATSVDHTLQCPPSLQDVQVLDAEMPPALEEEGWKSLIDEHNAALPHPGLEMTMAKGHKTNMTLLASALLERGLTVADLPSNLFLGDWEEDGEHFRGFIRVHMNLCRPISVVAGTRPPSIYDILKEDQTIEKTLTSFYLPRDTVKALHITSTTTTNEVIVALLKKFKVVDNPRKFALYERFYEGGETAKVKMRRIADNETPLVLALRWSKESNCNKMFVLQENDTGDILWEAFTLPELSNFLRILDREEEEYKRIVRLKYQQLATKIQEAMNRLSPPASTSADSSKENHSSLTENIDASDLPSGEEDIS